MEGTDVSTELCWPPLFFALLDHSEPLFRYFVILMGPIKIAHDRIRTKDLLVVFNKRTDSVPMQLDLR